MTFRKEEIKAGFVVLTGILIFVVFLIGISGMTFWDEYVEYRTVMAFASGLTAGKPVRYGGFQVGQVQEVTISQTDPTKIETVFHVLKNTPVTEGCVATVNTIGFMGEFYLEIKPDPDQGKPLPPGSYIPFKEVTATTEILNQFNRFSEQGSALISRFDAKIQELDVTAIYDAANSVKELVQSQSDDLNAVLKNLEQSTANMNMLMIELRDETKTTVGNVDMTLEKLQRLVDTSTNLMTKVDKTLQTLDLAVYSNSRDIGIIMNNLQLVSENLKEFSQNIKQRPWQMLRKSYPESRQVDK